MRTNKQLKHDAIEKAYGELWDRVKQHINFEDGSLPSFLSYEEETGLFYRELGFEHADVEHIDNDMAPSSWRVKSLIGIEYNNGWTRIEADGSNLPDVNSDGYYDLTSVRSNVTWKDGKFKARDVRTKFKEGKTTHYKLRVEYQMPIW